MRVRPRARRTPWPVVSAHELSSHGRDQGSSRDKRRAAGTVRQTNVHHSFVEPGRTGFASSSAPLLPRPCPTSMPTPSRYPGEASGDIQRIPRVCARARRPASTPTSRDAPVCKKGPSARRTQHSPAPATRERPPSRSGPLRRHLRGPDDPAASPPRAPSGSTAGTPDAATARPGRPSSTGLHHRRALSTAQTPAHQRRKSRPGSPDRDFPRAFRLGSRDPLHVREGGLEPPRPFGHWHLKPARLPFRHSRVPQKTSTMHDGARNRAAGRDGRHVPVVLHRRGAPPTARPTFTRSTTNAPHPSGDRATNRASGADVIDTI